MRLIKKLILISITLLFLVSISCASADDNITESKPVNLDGNFSEFNCEIQSSNNTLDLNRNYIDNADITINKSMTINGNGYSIASTSQSLKLNIENDITLILKNITFKNDKIDLDTGNSTIKLTFIDCRFKKPSIKNEIIVNFNESCEDYRAGNVSQIVKFLANAIAGNSTGLEAAKKLALWVGKNINHENRAGFYQSPDKTLNRSLGNCCSQTLLFLQMCEAVGINKDHKLYIVHVGNSNFGSRHFFAMIDNTFVDIDSFTSNPWGNAVTLKNNFYKITEYPYLPLKRNY